MAPIIANAKLAKLRSLIRKDWRFESINMQHMSAFCGLLSFLNVGKKN